MKYIERQYLEEIDNIFNHLKFFMMDHPSSEVLQAIADILQILADETKKKENDGWRTDKPDKNGWYMTTFENVSHGFCYGNGDRGVGMTYFENGKWLEIGEVFAWRDMPTAYRD